MAKVNLPDAPQPGGKPEERIRRLEIYCNQLNERLNFILTHLDDRNFVRQPEGGTTNGTTGTGG